MKQNQKNRHGSGRYNNSRNIRPQIIFRNTALESSGPSGKLHGTALQLFEKYQTAAKDALLQNDLILSETCLQHADHYMRLQNIAIENEQSQRQQYQKQAPQIPITLPEEKQPEEIAEKDPSPQTEIRELPKKKSFSSRFKKKTTTEDKEASVENAATA